MFSTTARSTRRVRIISAALAVGAMIAAFGMTAGSAAADTEGPVNTDSPSISGYTAEGDAVENNTLTAQPGAWTDSSSDPASIDFTYQWFSGAIPLTDPSADRTYLLKTSDVGKTVFVRVAASDDNGDGSAATSESSPVVVASGVANSVLPIITGSVSPGGTVTVSTGAWTSASSGWGYSYSWGYHGVSPDGQESADDISGSLNTITIERADEFDAYIVAFVTATDSNGHQATVRVQSATVVTPLAPFATDAGLTSDDEGGVTGTQTKTDATVVIPAPVEDLALVTSPGVGDIVYVYGYSTPTPLGFFTVAADHTITVPLGGLPKGLHKLAVINSSGQLVGWLSVTAGGGLASTGVNVNAPLELGAAGLLILVGLLSVIFVTRQRRKNEAK